jgi:protein-disulfide isomerase
MSFTQWGAELTVPVSPEYDHIRGPVDAPAWLLEYGDYECPSCGAAYPIVEEVRARMGDDLAFVFRHFPLTTVHPDAFQAAEGAEAAGAQGQFWPMHDLLYEDQRHLAGPDLVARAVALGLDVGRYQTELQGHVYSDRVQENFLSGVHSGVQGTPTFFINGIRRDGPWDLESLLAALQMSVSR